MTVSLILLGGLGGLLPDAIRIAKTMHDPATPAYLRTVQFYVGLLILFGLGCLAAWAAGAADPKQALAYGFGGPEFFSKIFADSGKEVRVVQDGAAIQRIRRWWSN